MHSRRSRKLSLAYGFAFLLVTVAVILNKKLRGRHGRPAPRSERPDWPRPYPMARDGTQVV